MEDNDFMKINEMLRRKKYPNIKEETLRNIDQKLYVSLDGKVYHSHALNVHQNYLNKKEKTVINLYKILVKKYV